MVLCDRCQRGFHCYSPETPACLGYRLDVTKLEGLPEWYCDDCCRLTGKERPGPEYCVPEGEGEGGIAPPEGPPGSPPAAQPPAKKRRGMPAPVEAPKTDGPKTRAAGGGRGRGRGRESGSKGGGKRG